MLRAEDVAPQASNASFEEVTGVELTSDDEQIVLTFVGEANACDVWMRVPAAWSGVTVQLYGLLADARVLLGSVKLSEIEVTSAAGILSAIPISVRGRPVTSFEVGLTRPRLVPLSNGAVYLQTWRDASATPTLRRPSSGIIGPSGAADTSSFNLGMFEGSWAPMQVDDNGFTLVSLQSITPGYTQLLADNATIAGSSAVKSLAVSAHRNQSGNWYMSRGGYSGAISSGDLPTLPNVLPTGAYVSTAPSPSNGGASALQVDGRGSLVVVQGRASAATRDAPSVYNAHAADKGVIKPGTGNLLAFDLTNKHTAGYWLHLFNNPANPNLGATPVWRAWIDAGQRYLVGTDIFTTAGVHYSTGISWGLSSTRPTFTALGGPPDVCVNAIYV